MTSRELVVRTLNHETVSRVPRDLWISPIVESTRAEEVAEMSVRFPSDLEIYQVDLSAGKKSAAKTSKQTEWTDLWGCVWQESENCAPAELKHSPLSEAARIAAFQPPPELFDRARFARVNKVCSQSTRFVLARSDVRPFNRFQFLRGAEAAMMDLARATKRSRDLLNVIHEIACNELRHWNETEVDGVLIADDWATPEGLLVAPEMWREIFRPLYREYCKILHEGDKFAFFHSKGNIRDIFGDLVKMEFDAINAQLHLMKFDRLVKRYRGQVTFWGGHPDNRLLHEPGTSEEFRQTVLATRRELDFGNGGVIAQCQWDSGVRLQTVASFFEQWLAPIPLHA